MPESRARYWGSRIALLVLSPLIFLAAVEALVTAKYGELDYPLPGIEEAARYLHFTMPERYNPLFELDPDSIEGEEGWFRTRPELWDRINFLVRDQRFPARRTQDALRVAFIGGSSVQGWPYRAKGASFAELVGERLSKSFPDRRIDIINAGVGAYSSFQLIDVAWQVRIFNPDVVVVYAGHNDQGYYLFHREFLDQASQNKPQNLQGAERFLNRFNFYQAARRLRDKGAVKPVKVDITHHQSDIFVPQEEYSDFVGKENYSEFVRIQQRYLPQLFARNLNDIIDTLHDDDTTVILVPPASNLRDVRPSFSMDWESISAEDLKRIEGLTSLLEQQLETAGIGPRTMPGISGNGEGMSFGYWAGPVWPDGSHELGSAEAVEACGPILEIVERGKAISSTWADFHFFEGTCLLHSDPQAAAAAFQRARDLSPALPPMQRAGANIQDAVRGVASERGVPLVDLPAYFDEHAALGIPGGELFVDTLHFSPDGAAMAADALAPAIARTPAFVGESSRRADPPAKETWRRVQLNSKEFRWGMDLEVPGAGAQKLGPDSDPTIGHRPQ